MTRKKEVETPDYGPDLVAELRRINKNLKGITECLAVMINDRRAIYVKEQEKLGGLGNSKPQIITSNLSERG